MSLQTWVETLITSQVDGAAVGNTVTATSILPAAAKITLPPNFFVVGKALRIEATGRISTLNPTPGNITLDVRFGGTVVANGGAIPLNTSVAKTNVPWYAEWILTCRAIGTTASLFVAGVFQSEALIGSATSAAGGNSALLIPVGAPAVGSTFDSTATQQVDNFVTFSVANAANTITCHQFWLQALN